MAATRAFEPPHGLDRDGEAAHSFGGPALDGFGAELGCQSQSFGVGIEVDGTGGTQSHRETGGVQADRRGRRAAQHEDLRAGTIGQAGRDRAVGVGDIVAGAGHGGRVHPGRERDQHGVGVRDADQVRPESTPVHAAHRAEAVGRHERDRGAAAGHAAAAGIATAAGDLERDDHPVPRPHRGDVRTDGDHFRHPFVPERVRAREREPPLEHGRVDIAGGHGNRAHQGLAGAFEGRFVDVLPAQRTGSIEHESLHDSMFYGTIVLVNPVRKFYFRRASSASRMRSSP